MCPQCNSPLNPVQVESHYERPFEVEQCPSCGGMWFDQDEYFRMDDEYVSKLDPLNETALGLNKPIPESLVCPKDGEKLISFDDPIVPDDIDVEWCPKCFGMWFNKGEFSELRAKRKQHATQEDTPRSPMQSLVYGALLIAEEQQRYRAQEEVRKVLASESAKSTVSYILGGAKRLPKTAWLVIIPVMIALYRAYKVSGLSNAHLSSDEFQKALTEIRQMADSTTV